MTIEKSVAVAVVRVHKGGNALRLVNNASAYCFKEARLSTTDGSDIDLYKYVEQVSTIMRVLPSKD